MSLLERYILQVEADLSMVLLAVVNRKPTKADTEYYNYTSLVPNHPPSPHPCRGRLVVWLEFLVTSTFLIRNVRWEIADCTIKSCYVIKVRNGHLNCIPMFAILCKRENSVHQRSVVLRATTNLLTSKFRGLASLHEGRMLPAVLAQVWWLKSGSLPLLSLATDAVMIGEGCWLLEGKATQQIKQQIENRSENCILGTIIICLLDTPSWQEIQIKPLDVLCQGA